MDGNAILSPIMSIPPTEASPEFGFDEKWYLAEYPDVKEAVLAGMFSSGLSHYLAYGRRERRRPGPINAIPHRGNEASPTPIVAPNGNANPAQVVAKGGDVTSDADPTSFGVGSAVLRGDSRGRHLAARVADAHDESSARHFVAKLAQVGGDAPATSEVAPQHRDFGAAPIPLVALVSEVGEVGNSAGSAGSGVDRAAPGGGAKQMHVAAKAASAHNVADPPHSVTELVQAPGGRQSGTGYDRIHT
jgi:hypothetical protein